MPKSTFQRKPKRKFCQFCAEKQDYIDYKDVNLLRPPGHRQLRPAPARRRRRRQERPGDGPAPVLDSMIGFACCE
jgi:hypothetical protein